MMLLPRCPRFTDADPTLFDRYEAFISGFVDGNGSGGEMPLQDAARNLASDLHSEAMRLGTSKAYEFSDDIYWLDQCAATVTLFAFGRYSSEFKKYESAVHYYKNFPSTVDRVKKFDSYVQST